MTSYGSGMTLLSRNPAVDYSSFTNPPHGYFDDTGTGKDTLATRCALWTSLQPHLCQPDGGSLAHSGHGPARKMAVVFLRRLHWRFERVAFVRVRFLG